jgi:subtilisin family serine protease
VGEKGVMRNSLAFPVALLVSLALAPGALAADPLRSQQWGLDMIEADAAHQTSTGSGVVVAVVDTGVLAGHEDLAGRLVTGRDFIQNPNDSKPQDENGHGTHVTGIIAANANNGKGIEGVAPGARVMPIRVLDANGEGDGDTVAKGIDYAVAHGADVINLSLGSDAIGTIVGGDDKFTQAVQHALSKGVIVIAAAGNDTTPFCEQPVVTGPLLCVGAVDRDEMRTFYSSSGDLVAPGGSALFGGPEEDILSTYNDGKYESIAGTSQATPHVAGVAALLMARGLRGQAVTNRILATAKDVGLSGPDDVYGAGIVNARAAVAGLGGGGGGPGGGGGGAGGGGVKPGISYKHTQKISSVLKHGVKLRCRASKAGRCKVRVRARGKVIASGSRTFGRAGRATVTAKVTKAGRKMLRGVKKKLRSSLAVNVPGGGKRTGKLTLKR